jgi:hypothetical protein
VSWKDQRNWFSDEWFSVRRRICCSFQSEDLFSVFDQTIHSKNREKVKTKRAGKDPGSPKVLKRS